MSFADLSLKDARRMLTVLSRMKDGSGTTPSLGELWKRIRADAEAANDTRKANASEFAPFEVGSPPVGDWSAVRAWLKEVKEAVIDEYGREYAEDLWRRVQR